MAFGQDALGLLETSRPNEVIDFSVPQQLGRIASSESKVGDAWRVAFRGRETFDPRIGTDYDPVWVQIRERIIDPEWIEEGHRLHAAEAAKTAPVEPHKDEL